RGVDPLVSDRDGSPAQALPGVLEIFRETLRQGSLGRGPAIVPLPFLEPLLAVVAQSTCHVPIVAMERVQTAVVGNRDQPSQTGDCTQNQIVRAMTMFRPLSYDPQITKNSDPGFRTMAA